MLNPSLTLWEDSFANISIPPQKTLRGELDQYLDFNSDLDRELALAMAPFALRYVLRPEGIRRMFSNMQSTTPWYHTPWFWWQALVNSDLERLWPGEKLNTGEWTPMKWHTRLIVQTTEDEQKLLLRRLYKKKLYRTRADYPLKKTLWSKGGKWYRSRGLDRILVLGENLDRPYKNWWSEKLTPWFTVLEQELRSVANPDRLLAPHAYWQACEYIRERTRSLTGKKIHWRNLTWFFDMDIQQEDGRWWRKTDGRLLYQGARRDYRW
jgi:hypothetical protein